MDLPPPPLPELATREIPDGIEVTYLLGTFRFGLHLVLPVVLAWSAVVTAAGIQAALTGNNAGIVVAAFAVGYPVFGGITIVVRHFLRRMLLVVVRPERGLELEFRRVTGESGTSNTWHVLPWGEITSVEVLSVRFAGKDAPRPPYYGAAVTVTGTENRVVLLNAVERDKARVELLARWWHAVIAQGAGRAVPFEENSTPTFPVNQVYRSTLNLLFYS